MSNYNFKISGLSYSVSDSSKTLEVTLSGNNFPIPDDTNGTIKNGDVVFDLDLSSGDTTDSVVFSYSGSGFTSGNFRFEDIPLGSSNVVLAGEARNYNDHGDFAFDSCELTEAGSGGHKKNLGAKGRRRPGVSQSFQVNSFTLTQVNIDGSLELAAVMKVSNSSGSNDLEATCSDEIDFSEIGHPLPIVIQNESDNDSVEVIARVYIDS